MLRFVFDPVNRIKSKTLYTADHRILYGTGRVVAWAGIEAFAEGLLARPEGTFVDVRSARNNCYQLRIHRG